MPNYILHTNNTNKIRHKLEDNGYYLYSTQSNDIPLKSTANNIGDGTFTNINSANYDFSADWNGSNGNVTTVGTNGGPSFYGTYDQSGQVWEWNETVNGLLRGVRGGSWLNSSLYIGSSYRGFTGAGPSFGNGNVGFRIGCAVTSNMGSIEWVTIRDINNDIDILGFGSVSYPYKISKYPITNQMYCDFLNLKAQSDPYQLYNTNMGSAIYGGITRSGASGSYVYNIRNNMTNKPVVYISWYDALRFANWLHNGAGSGNTETGAYSLNGATSGVFTRNPDALFWLTSEDEWYKAAYYFQINKFYINHNES